MGPAFFHPPWGFPGLPPLNATGWYLLPAQASHFLYSLSLQGLKLLNNVKALAISFWHHHNLGSSYPLLRINTKSPQRALQTAPYEGFLLTTPPSWHLWWKLCQRDFSGVKKRWHLPDKQGSGPALQWETCLWACGSLQQAAKGWWGACWSNHHRSSSLVNPEETWYCASRKSQILELNFSLVLPGYHVRQTAGPLGSCQAAHVDKAKEEDWDWGHLNNSAFFWGGTYTQAILASGCVTDGAAHQWF